MRTVPLCGEGDLVAAVKAGRESRVRALLAEGCDVGGVDREGKTVVHWACQYGHLPVLRLLLAHVSITPFPSTMSPSLCACGARCVWRGQQHSDTATRHIDDDVSDDMQNDRVSDAPALPPVRDCVGDVCTCNRLASHVINCRDVKGHTPLHIACNYRREDVASYLLTSSLCDVNVVDKAGNTALHRSIHNDLSALCYLLCECGADVRAANNQGLTPLHEAMRVGNEGVVRTLLARDCDVNASTRSRAAPTPFLTAVFYHKISSRPCQHATFLDSTLPLLVQAGCRLSQGDYQWTPLSAAIDIDNSAIATLLLLHGCRFQKSYSKSSYGRSVLVEAFTRCDMQVVRLLLTCGYQPSLHEVEQCARRIPSFSPLFYRISHAERAAMRDKLHLLTWLRERACSVPSLMEASRASVRMALNYATGDTSIINMIPLLPLPAVLCRFVALSDFTENI